MKNTTFDYVIVGAGSAGAVLANRLSADPAVSVCLIEAGPPDTGVLFKVPLGLMLLAKHKSYNWLYSSTPQRGLNSREVSIPRGKALGGSSAINGMVYIRGHRADYDSWASAGCAGWDYDSVLPYFVRSEANSRIKDAHHGVDGELSVTDLKTPNPVSKVFVEAAGRVQIPVCKDFNVAEPEGVGVYQVTQRNGLRHSSAAAFLKPVKNRQNLHIETGREVQKVLFSQGRASGVQLTSQSEPGLSIDARVELILCAGAIGSPDILLKSGVGPGEQLNALGTTVVHDLTGVGANLHDHVDVMSVSRSRSSVPYGVSIQAVPKLIAHGLKYALSRDGMLASNMVEAGGFVRSSSNLTRPDIQFHIIPGRKSMRGRLIEYGHGVSLHACVLNPTSRGSITRTDPVGPPRIDLGLLNDEDDLIRLRKGLQAARRILAQEPFKPYGLTEVLPGEHVQGDEELDSYVREHARTVYHPVGTCAMGVGDDAVVDPRLRVRGVHGLRVVDASVMPTIVSGNTNAPTIMIAEKAADMIIEDRRAGNDR